MDNHHDQQAVLPLTDHQAELDGAHLASELDRYGVAVISGLLQPSACRALAA